MVAYFQSAVCMFICNQFLNTRRNIRLHNAGLMNNPPEATEIAAQTRKADERIGEMEVENDGTRTHDDELVRRMARHESHLLLSVEIAAETISAKVKIEK